MAYSGDFSTDNQYIKFNLEIVPSPPDVANNRTWVEVRLWARRTNTGYTTWGQGYVNLSVDGVAHNTGTHGITITNTNKVYHTWAGWINHGSDGKKYLSVSGSIQIPSILASSTATYGTQLSDIPRVSDFTIPSSATTGGNLTVTINKASSGFTHNITYIRPDGVNVTIQPWNFTGSSHTFTIAPSDANNMPNSTSGTASVQVSTYSGSTLVGYKTKTFTLNVAADVKPTLAGGTTLEVVNATWGLCIKGRSKIKIKANTPTGAYGSSIRSVVFETAGYSGTVSSTPWEYTTGFLNSPGSQSVKVTVTDSRGRSNVYTNGFTVTDYYSPYFRSYAAERCDASGTPDSNGTFLRVSANLDHCQIGENSGTVQYRFRLPGGTWSTWTTFTNGGNTGAMGDGALSLDNTYEVEIKGADFFSEVIKPVLIPTMVLPIDFLAGGDGVAIGKTAEHPNLLEIAWDVKIHGGIETGGVPVVASGSSVNGTWVRYSDGTQICTKRFVQGISNLNAWGTLWESYAFPLGVWARDFVADSIPVVSLQCGQGAFFAWPTTCHGTNASNIGTTSLCRPTNVLNTEAVINIIGIGRWKA